MSINYRKNYFRIYFWQAISILLGFASLFVVVPYLSSDKTLYGIYSVCTSLTIFFSYADLGFISAGVKYAAEYFIQGDRRNEMRVIGFTAFIMISAFAVVALAILLLAIRPEWLVPDVAVGSDGYYIARALLFTLAIACPIIMGQRILGIVFTIRVEDYLYQRMMIVGNIVRILSVLYFFHNGQYRVVEYYIFYQAVNLIVVICGLVYTRRYGYRIIDLLHSIHFDREVFDKVKTISGTSLIMTLCMILYYELDQVVISHWVGIDAVAVYGAALSVLTLVRTFCSLLYSPYTSRYNHYVGLNDMEGLVCFVRKMISMFGPILVIPIATIAVFSKPFVVSWIGEQYADSALLVLLLVLSFASNYVKDPIGCYFIATERNRILIRYNVLMPIIYWIGVVVTINYLGLLSFAIFKFVAPTIVALYYWNIAARDFQAKGFEFASVKESVLTLLPPIIALLLLGYILIPNMWYNHDKISLLYNICAMAIALIISIVVGVLFNKTLRSEVISYSNTICKRIRR